MHSLTGKRPDRGSIATYYTAPPPTDTKLLLSGCPDSRGLRSVCVRARRGRTRGLLEFTSTQALLEATPKVSYYDVVLQSDSLLTITEIAKDYGLSAKKLNMLLHDAGVQFRQSGVLPVIEQDGGAA